MISVSHSPEILCLLVSRCSAPARLRGGSEEGSPNHENYYSTVHQTGLSEIPMPQNLLSGPRLKGPRGAERSVCVSFCGTVLKRLDSSSVSRDSNHRTHHLCASGSRSSSVYTVPCQCEFHLAAARRGTRTKIGEKQRVNLVALLFISIFDKDI